MKALIFLALTAAVWGQEQPTPKAFWAAAGVSVTVVALDAYTTHRAVGYGCIEGVSPILYGQRPTLARFSLLAGTVELGELLAARRMVRSRRAFWRTAGYTLVVGETVNRARYVAGNFKLNRKVCR